MRKRLQSNIALVCVLCFALAALCGFRAPAGTRNGYAPVSVYVDGLLTTSGYLVDGRTYLPLPDYCAALKLTYAPETPAAGESLRAQLGGLEMWVSGDGKYIAANGRYFYLADGLRIIGGVPCLPVVELAKLYCAQVSWDYATSSADIDTTAMRPLTAGDVFYDAEDLAWLSRIINAESGNQSLEGMMGVGNVVLNRVANPACPDTVYEVIFDTRYGVQFSPVETGSIYNEPNELSVVAAKLCLEGYNVAGNSLYFVNPATGSTSWFRRTRTFVVSIGEHDFYA